MRNKIKRYGFGDFKAHIKNINNFNKAGLSSSFALFIIGMFAVLPFVPHMDGAEAAPSPTESESVISVVTGNESARLDLVPGTESGVFATSKEEDLAKFSVTTNSFTGYTLSVISSDENENGQLVSADPNNTNVLSSIDEITGKTTFKDGTVYNGKWGFKPNKYVDGSEVIDNTTLDNYLPSPDKDGTVIDITGVANTTPNEYTIALGARANSTFQQGTYSKTFNLVAVGNPATYTITFADTSGDTTLANMPNSIGGSSAKTYVVLPNDIPTRAGGTFDKWCSVVPVDGSCPSGGTKYNVGGRFYLDQTTNNMTTLYATWKKTYSLTVEFAGEGVQAVEVRTAKASASGGACMDEDCPDEGTESDHGGELIGTVTTSGGAVSGLSGNGEYYLYPIFENKFYSLVDWTNIGNFGILYEYNKRYKNWDSTDTTTDFNPKFEMEAGNSLVRITGSAMTMQEFGSLSDEDKYPIVASMNLNTIYTLKDSRDDQTYAIAKLNDGRVWMAQNLNLGAIELINDLTSENTNLSQTISARDFNYWVETATRNLENITSYYNIGTAAPISGNNQSSGLPYGVSYNYYAASAGTINTSSNSKNAQYDICPKGWRLPTGGSSSGEFYELYGAYNSRFSWLKTNITSGGANFYFAGYFLTDQSLEQQEDTGIYWSSTRASNTNMYALLIDPESRLAGSNLAYSYRRDNGASIRCVLDYDGGGAPAPSDPVSGSDMQDFVDNKDAMIYSMVEGQNYFVSDHRGMDTAYSIAKFGNTVWMTSDLRLENIQEDLNSSNTNISMTVTASTFNGAEGSSYISGLYTYDFATFGGIGGDICPAGWRLPTRNELTNLYTNSAHEAGFELRGRFDGGVISGAGSNGYYWTTTPESSDRRYVLHLMDSPTTGGFETLSEYTGAAIRCILK